MNHVWLKTGNFDQDILRFQVFVANPNKPKPILEILLRNREKLVEFLTKFHSERTDDEQFNDEKAYLIKQIKDLKVPVESTSAAAHWLHTADNFLY